METQSKIKELYLSLNKAERSSMLKELKIASFELPINEGLMTSCPHCNGQAVVKHGMHKGEQRYRCVPCNRTFKVTTGTIVGLIKKKGAFLAYQHMMLNENYLSLEDMAKRVNISIPTVFAWRHKILLSLPSSSSKFEGETEMDDLWILYSQKGRKGLAYSRKRGGSKRQGDNNFQVKVLAVANKDQVDLKVAKIGRIAQVDIQRTMGDRFSKKATIISDKHQSIAAFARNQKLNHIGFKASKHTTEDGKGVQLVNNIAERLKHIVNRKLRGVSTKYLQMYLNWFRTKENFKKQTEEDEIFQKAILINKTAWNVYINREKTYERFIKNHSVRTYRCPTVSNTKAQFLVQESVENNQYI